MLSFALVLGWLTDMPIPLRPGNDREWFSFVRACLLAQGRMSPLEVNIYLRAQVYMLRVRDRWVMLHNNRGNAIQALEIRNLSVEVEAQAREIVELHFRVRNSIALLNFRRSQTRWYIRHHTTDNTIIRAACMNVENDLERVVRILSDALAESDDDE